MSPRKARGFTLIELVMVITIIAILAGAIVPAITKPITYERRADTIREMQAIEEAILGRPDLDDFGYLGSMGKLPANLDHLLKKPGTLPASSYQEGLPTAWNGPYLQGASNAPLEDAWGTPYQLVTNTSDANLWQLHSWGPNRVSGGPIDDDIILPSRTTWHSSRGSVLVTMAIPRGGTRTMISPTWVQGTSLKVPRDDGNLYGYNCVETVPGQCVAHGLSYGLHVLQTSLTAESGFNGTVITRPVKVTKPMTTVEVTLLEPGPVPTKSCYLNTAAATGIASGVNCPTDFTPVPPGGRFTVSISGELRRTAGTARCVLAPQVLDIFPATPTTNPSSTVAGATAPASLPITLQATETTQAFSSRTFANSTATTMHLRPGAVLYADSGGTTCAFEGQVSAYRLDP